MFSRRLVNILAVLMVGLLAGCNVFNKPAPSATPTFIPILFPPVASQLSLIITPTPTPSPILTTPTRQPATKAAPTFTLPPANAQTVMIYLVALNDNGRSGQKIGCDDSLVPVKVSITPTLGVLRAALVHLLGIKTPYYGQSGLYNALYQSDLSIESLVVQNGEALIQLKGKLLLGGVCDNPRVQSQLTEIALQFSTVKKVRVYVNNTPLENLLSLR